MNDKRAILNVLTGTRQLETDMETPSNHPKALGQRSTRWNQGANQIENIRSKTFARANPNKDD
jgi:hypothetical protein